MNTAALGHPDNGRTKRAPIDALAIARAFWRDDDAATSTLLRHCDPYSVSLQLCGWLYVTLQRAGVDIDDRLGIWLDAVRAQIGENE